MTSSDIKLTNVASRFRDNNTNKLKPNMTLISRASSLIVYSNNMKDLELIQDIRISAYVAVHIHIALFNKSYIYMLSLPFTVTCTLSLSSRYSTQSGRSLTHGHLQLSLERD